MVTTEPNGLSPNDLNRLLHEYAAPTHGELEFTAADAKAGRRYAGRCTLQIEESGDVSLKAKNLLLKFQKALVLVKKWAVPGKVPAILSISSKKIPGEYFELLLPVPTHQ